MCYFRNYFYSYSRDRSSTRPHKNGPILKDTEVQLVNTSTERTTDPLLNVNPKTVAPNIVKTEKKDHANEDIEKWATEINKILSQNVEKPKELQEKSEDTNNISQKLTDLNTCSGIDPLKDRHKVNQLFN